MPRLGPRALGAILILAAAARLALALQVGLGAVQFGDAPAYLYAAEQLARTGRYPATTDVGFFRPPGYPAFLVLATLGHPERLAPAKLANVALGSLAVLVLAALSARIFRSRRIAIATGIGGALAPGLVLISSDIQSEPLFLLLLLSAAFLLLVSVDRPSSTLALLAGGALGLSALTRPTSLALIPFLLAPLADRRYPFRIRSHIAGAALLGALLSVGPWTLRNAVVFREFIPVNDADGRAFYEGNSVWARRYYALRSRAEYAAWLTAEDLDIRKKLGEAEAGGVFSPRQRARAFRDMALQDVRADPAAALGLLLQKFWFWLRPYPTTWFRSAPVVWLTGLYYGVLYALAAAGFLSARRRGVRLFALGILTVSLASHALIIVVWRYRIPYWDPVLLLYGVPGGARLLSL
ncbi:MAG: glycosyltransferase family 39 protein [Acidobacteria bacterium]|nr:glycosyltransferase family 39 protein [Acidobacteriota bacterium]